MRPLYWFWESEIPADKCQEIIDEYFTKADIEDGLIQSEGAIVRDDEVRISDIAWAPVGTPLFDLLFGYIQTANKNVWNYDLSGMESVQVGRYKDGGHYDWHADSQDPCPNNYERKLSCTLQLSDESTYEGGDLILKKNNFKEEIITRKQGSIIVFPSSIMHKVTPVTSGVRFSAVAWMRGPAFK